MSDLGESKDGRLALNLYFDGEHEAIRDQDGRLLDNVVGYELSVQAPDSIPVLTVKVLLPPTKYASIRPLRQSISAETLGLIREHLKANR